MDLILKLKANEIPEKDVSTIFHNKGIKSPSPNTIHKYYSNDVQFSTDEMIQAYKKEKAFEEPHCKKIIVDCLIALGNGLKISSLYDLLQEQLVDESNILTKLPGNEQTLRNYCHHLINSNEVSIKKKVGRIYDAVETPPPGKQVQLDYGEQKLLDNSKVYFIVLILRYSRLMYIKGMDHKFNAEATCNALYSFFATIGGKVQEIAIDQDACMIYREKYGEIIETRVFKDFLDEQNLRLYVCHKADPESKGAVEKAVQFVKSNYLSSRLSQPIKTIIEKMPAWYQRKNKRIHGTEHWYIDKQFEQFEKPTLLPLQPSQYDVLSSERYPCSVSKTHDVHYRNNTYTLPVKYSNLKVYRSTTKKSISFYETKNGDDWIHMYELPPEGIIHQRFSDPKFKKVDGHEWLKIRKKILQNYPCYHMQIFLDGVKKENQKYLYPQHKALLKLFDERFTTTKELEEILNKACECYRYHVLELTELWDLYWKEHNIHVQQEKEKPAEYKCKQSNAKLAFETVQTRDLSQYEDLFQQKAGNSAC